MERAGEEEEKTTNKKKERKRRDREFYSLLRSYCFPSHLLFIDRVSSDWVQGGKMTFQFSAHTTNNTTCTTATASNE